MQIEYARVSTQEQSLALQLDTLRQAGCRKVYEEVISGGACAQCGDTSLSEAHKPVF
jgi:DNA invertase Pin-like site-specific DNA recombinase